MQSDFLDAHNRHWQDAEQLFEAQRWANADQLFGMAAECGLKSLCWLLVCHSIQTETCHKNGKTSSMPMAFGRATRPIVTAITKGPTMV